MPALALSLRVVLSLLFFFSLARSLANSLSFTDFCNFFCVRISWYYFFCGFVCLFVCWLLSRYCCNITFLNTNIRCNTWNDRQQQRFIIINVYFPMRKKNKIKTRMQYTVHTHRLSLNCGNYAPANKSRKNRKEKRNSNSNSNKKSELTPLSRTMTINCTHTHYTQNGQTIQNVLTLTDASRWSLIFSLSVFFSLDFSVSY